MLQLGSPKKKEVSIANLRLLTALYGDWIKNELKENPQMQESSFQATGKSIIEATLLPANEILEAAEDFSDE